LHKFYVDHLYTVASFNFFRLEKEDGPAHDRKFLYSVQVQAQGHTYVTLGEPFSRVKDAENSGAQEMLKLLSKQVGISGE
jgi:dsRNA-specific ribonuclease